MDSLFNIMGSKDFSVPSEITEIKAYVQRHFQSDVSVAINERSIVITARSAALAGSLQPHLYRLAKQLDTPKKLVIRIG